MKKQCQEVSKRKRSVFLFFSILFFSISTFLFITVFLGCHVIKPHVAPIPKDSSECVAASNNLKKMRCFDRSGSAMWINKRGVPFSETCLEDQNVGRIFLNPDCIVRAKKCSSVMKCPVEGM